MFHCWLIICSINFYISILDFREKFLSTVKYFNSGEIFSKVEGFAKVEIHGEAKEFSISNSHIAAAFSQQGLLKAITLKKSGITVPLHLDFAR